MNKIKVNLEVYNALENFKNSLISLDKNDRFEFLILKKHHYKSFTCESEVLNDLSFFEISEIILKGYMLEKNKR